MRCRYDVPVPLIIVLIDLNVPSLFIHIQSNEMLDPRDLLSRVDIETMLIYIDFPAVASLDVQFLLIHCIHLLTFSLF